jgi:thioredoxin 2
MTRSTPPGGGEASSAGQRTIDDRDFDALVRTTEMPVILAFTAEWCAPCKWLDPHLDTLSTRAAGRIAIYRVDTDRSPGIARTYRVGSVPTVVLVRGGEEVERSVGVEPERLAAWADRLLGEGRGGPHASGARGSGG